MPHSCEREMRASREHKWLASMRQTLEVLLLFRCLVGLEQRAYLERVPKRPTVYGASFAQAKVAALKKSRVA